jgi:hypothetical protein
MAFLTEVSTITKDLGMSIAELRARFTATNTPLTQFFYKTTDGGQTARWRFDPADTTTADDGVLTLVTTTGGHRFKRVFRAGKIPLDWWDVSDYGPIVEKITDLGYTVKCRRRDYPFTTYVQRTNASLIIEGNGATWNFTNATAGYCIDVENEPETSYDVIAISALAASSTATGNTDVLNTTLGGTHGTSYIRVPGNLTAVFEAGDDLRIYALNEFIPGFSTTLGNGNYAVMKGEWLVPELVVYDSDNNETRIVIQRTLTHTYTIDGTHPVKICRMKKNTLQISNLNITLKSRVVTGAINIVGAMDPVIRDVTTRNMWGPGVNIRACVNGMIDNLKVRNSQNGPVEGLVGSTSAQTGYGVNEGMNHGLQVINCKFYNCRHAFTTGTGSQISETDPYLIGEGYNTLVMGCFAKGCVHAFDTHNAGFSISFIGNIIDTCAYGYQGRARGIKISGGKIYKTGQPVYLKIFYTGVDNIPTTIEGLDIEMPYYVSNPTAIKINHVANYKVNIRNCNLKGGMVEVDIADVDITGCTVDTTLSFTGTEMQRWLDVGSGATAKVWNTYVKSSHNGFIGVNMPNANGECYLDNVTFETPNDSTPVLFQAGNTGQVAVAKNITFLGGNGPSITSVLPPVNYVNGLSDFSKLQLQWKHIPLTSALSDKNSCMVGIGGSGAVNITSIGYLLDEHITVKITSSADASLSSLPNMPYPGQKVTFVLTTNTTFTLPTLQGVSKVLKQYETATAIYVSTGVWYWEGSLSNLHTYLSDPFDLTANNGSSLLSLNLTNGVWHITGQATFFNSTGTDYQTLLDIASGVINVGYVYGECKSGNKYNTLNISSVVVVTGGPRNFYLTCTSPGAIQVRGSAQKETQLNAIRLS